MSVGTVVLVAAIAVIAGSYSWAMRGTILGGEKGCALPGAMLGIILAYASGVEQIKDNFWIFAALGAAAMFFGGAQSYGQTISLSYDRENSKRRHKGRIGLFLKGANWFAIFAGLMAIGFGAVAGKYTVLELCLLTASLPAAKWLGFLVLNCPQKPKEGKFPRFYFSEGRFEVWGGMLFVAVDLLIFSIIKGEWFAALMCVFGYVGGGLGFFIGNLFQTGTPSEGINGKYLLGKLQKNGFVGSWKFMEFTLGAMGALFVSVCFCLFFVKSGYGAEIAANGLWQPLGEWDSRINGIWIVIFVLYTLLYLVPPPRPILSEIKEKLECGQISESRYNELLKYATDKPQPKILEVVRNSDEILIWPIFSYLPIIISLLGGLAGSKIISGFLIFWLLAEEIVFSPQDKEKVQGLKVLRIILLVVSAFIFLAQLGGFSFNAWQTWIMYCISYEAVETWNIFAPKHLKARKSENGGLGKALLSFKESFCVRVFSFAEILALLVLGSTFFAG